MPVLLLLLLLWPLNVRADMNQSDTTGMVHSGHDMAAPMDMGPASSHDAVPGMHQVMNSSMDHAADHAATPPMEHGADHAAMNGTGHVHPVTDNDPGVGVIEHLGGYIAGDATFRDESGRTVTMAEIVDKPTIIVPIYFSCPNVCAIIQSSLSLVLPDVSLTAGEEYQVVSVSFDDTDTPELAAHQKRNYMAAMDFKFPENGWRFLTGDMHNIRKLTDSLGFGFKKQGKDFLHPVVIMAVSPKGKIVRYLYGTKPLAFDLTMAATEAGKEQVGLSVKRVLAYCFSYDPAGKRYVFNFMKITGTGILIVLGGLLIGLLAAGRKKRDPK